MSSLISQGREVSGVLGGCMEISGTNYKHYERHSYGIFVESSNGAQFWVKKPHIDYTIGWIPRYNFKLKNAIWVYLAIIWRDRFVFTIYRNFSLWKSQINDPIFNSKTTTNDLNIISKPGISFKECPLTWIKRGNL